jgi:hypothetical protein
MPLSNIFKYISKFRSDGHSIGRKVGDLLELIVYSSLIINEKFKNKLHIEPKLYGFCDSGHKVEFAITKKENSSLLKGGEIKDPKSLAGFIECKKVGVEQTTNSTFKKNYSSQKYLFNYDEEIQLKIDKTIFKLSIIKENNYDFVKIKINEKIFKEKLVIKHRIILATNNKKTEIILNNGSLRDFEPTLDRCKIFEIETKNNKFFIMLNDCLAGPQTPEKAKQSSFVALDVRRLRYGKFDKIQNEQDFVSVLIITESDHWENKSRNMVRACLDRTLIVDDSLLIEAMIQLELQFGINFIELISKNEFEKNVKLMNLINSLVSKYNSEIYIDLDNNKKVKIDLNKNGCIVFN